MNENKIMVITDDEKSILSKISAMNETDKGKVMGFIYGIKAQVSDKKTG